MIEAETDESLQSSYLALQGYLYILRTWIYHGLCASRERIE